MRGLPFTREQEVTGAVWRGGDQPPPSGKDDPAGERDHLCRLLGCLLSTETLSPELVKRLGELGISLAGLRRCLKEYCADPRPSEIERSGPNSERLGRLLAELSPQSLELLAELAQERNRGF